MTPIDYYAKGTHAVKAYNTSTKDELAALDVRILSQLSTALRGYPAMQLRKDVQDDKQVFSAVFNRAINRLIALEYITRTPHRKWIYYNITMKGRNALAQLNEHLIQIVDEQLAKLSKHK